MNHMVVMNKLERSSQLHVHVDCLDPAKLSSANKEQVAQRPASAVFKHNRVVLREPLVRGAEQPHNVFVPATDSPQSRKRTALCLEHVSFVATHAVMRVSGGLPFFAWHKAASPTSLKHLDGTAVATEASGEDARKATCSQHLVIQHELAVAHFKALRNLRKRQHVLLGL
jgi:hypothetical protein